MDELREEELAVDEILETAMPLLEEVIREALRETICGTDSEEESYSMEELLADLEKLEKEYSDVGEEVEEREWNQACWRNTSYRYNIHQKQRNAKPKIFCIRNHTRKMKKGQHDR